MEINYFLSLELFYLDSTSLTGKEPDFMLDILKEYVQTGMIDKWPTEGYDLLILIRSIGYFRRKALWAAIHALEEVDEWHSAIPEFLLRYVSEDLLINTAAELYHNSFDKDNNRLLLLLGLLLGEKALGIPKFYENASSFITRVVGLRYEDRQKEAAALQVGMPVNLTREPDNRYDPHAVAVVAPWGAKIGYLRASLAEILASRYAKGELFAARVAAVMQENFGPNERVYIEVLRENSYTGGFVLKDLDKARGIDDHMIIEEEKLLIHEDEVKEI